MFPRGTIRYFCPYLYFMGEYGPILLILGSIGLYFYTQSKAAGNLVFFPGTITAMDFENTGPVAYGTIIVQNTSNATLSINSIAANVFTNGQLIGNLSEFGEVLIPGNGQAQIPVKITFQLLGIVNDIVQAFKTGHFKQDLSIEGYVNAGGVQAELKLTYKVG